jgi:outer membrane lipoprotein carrier protein
MTAQFKEVVYSHEGTPLQQSSGTMAIKRPGKFLWKTETPLKQTLVTDGNKLWIYDIDLEQLVIQPIPSNIAKTPLILLTAPQANLRKQFVIASAPSKNANEWFKLTPKEKNDTFTAISIGFRRGIPAQMELTNTLDQTTVITFLNTQRNVPLSDTLFSIHLPPNHTIDIIDQTHL